MTWGLNWWTFLVWVVGWMLLFLLLPPRYDPAIRLKEWLQRRHR